MFRQPITSETPEAASPPFPFGLGRAGMHELVEAGFGDFPALTGFALAALRDAGRPGVSLWVRQRTLSLEHGRVCGQGLVAAGLDPGRLLLVEARDRMEALRAVEEGARDKALAAVVAELDDMDFTAARRLVLASQDSGVPLVLMFPHKRSGATAAHGRWRVSAQPSMPDPHDQRAPGRPAWRAMLEKSRLRPGDAGRDFYLELHDETPCLRLVSGLATATPRPQPRRLGPALAGSSAGWRRTG